jgi:hypothetical protein
MNDNLIKNKDNINLKVKYIYSNLKEKSNFLIIIFKFMTIILPI